MTMNPRLERELRSLAEKGGAQCVSLEMTRGSHIRMVVRAPSGNTQVVICALTPSDRRSAQNTLSIIKRFVRQETPREETRG